MLLLRMSSHGFSLNDARVATAASLYLRQYVPLIGPASAASWEPPDPFPVLGEVMDLAKANHNIQRWRQQRPPGVQGLLALRKAFVHAAVQIDLSEQNPEPCRFQDGVAAGKAHEREGPSDDHAEDEGKQRAVAPAAGDAALRLELVLKQFFLNLREMGIIRYRDKTLLRRRDESRNTCTSRTR